MRDDARWARGILGPASLARSPVLAPSPWAYLGAALAIRSDLARVSGVPDADARLEPAGPGAAGADPDRRRRPYQMVDVQSAARHARLTELQRSRPRRR